MPEETICIVIPAYNEERHLEDILKKMSEFGHVVVVDDASTDKTFEIASTHAHRVILNKENRGYEQSLEIGITRSLDYEYIVTCDADGEIPVESIISCIEQLKSGATLVLGCRNIIPRWSEKVVNYYAKRRYGVSDILCGMKGYRSEFISEPINFTDNVATGIAKQMLRQKVNTKFVSVNIVPRTTESRYGASLRTHLKILKAMFYG